MYPEPHGSLELTQILGIEGGDGRRQDRRDSSQDSVFSERVSGRTRVDSSKATPLLLRRL